MYDTDNWPAHGEELARKALTVLDKYMAKEAAGVITIRELFLLVSALYDTISGLIPDADLSVFEAVHTEIRANAARR